MKRYVDYLLAIQTLDPTKLKFCDESHIVSKDLDDGKMLGMVSERVYRRASSLHSRHASLTLLTNFGNPDEPVVIDYREETNTQWDFYNFVKYCCEEGHLESGDILIVDNAAVHGGSDSQQALDDLLDHFEVGLIFLPAYSPELNPCELVFSVIKRHIRNNRQIYERLMVETLQAVSTITQQHLEGFYLHCIFPRQILPDLPVE